MKSVRPTLQSRSSQGIALLLFAANSVYSQPSSIDIVQALEEAKSSLYERIGPGVVKVQVVRHDLPTGLLTALQGNTHEFLADSYRRGEITADELDLWRQWTDRFLELTENRLDEADAKTDPAALGDWGAFFDGVYLEWWEKTVPKEEPVPSSLRRFAEKIKSRVELLKANLKTHGLYNREPVVLRQSTGFVFDRGLVVTTQEVAVPKNADEWIRVFSGDRVVFSTGELVGKDEETNIAVIRLASPGSELLPTLHIDPALRPRVGSFVYAFYHAFNQPLSMCSGEITGGLRPLPVYRCASFFETSLSTSPGMLGSPLVNARGELVGMRTAFMRQQSMSEVTYALPVDQLAAVASQIVQHGAVERACIGVYVDEVAQSNSLKHFVLVRGVMPDSPASRSGVKVGDIIVALDGKPVYCRMTLLNALSAYKPNDPVTLDIEREGRPEKIQVSLAPMPQRAGQ